MDRTSNGRNNLSEYSTEHITLYMHILYLTRHLSYIGTLEKRNKIENTGHTYYILFNKIKKIIIIIV
jgi:hypothetical protein